MGKWYVVLLLHFVKVQHLVDFVHYVIPIMESLYTTISEQVVATLPSSPINICLHIRTFQLSEHAPSVNIKEQFSYVRILKSDFYMFCLSCVYRLSYFAYLHHSFRAMIYMHPHSLVPSLSNPQFFYHLQYEKSVKIWGLERVGTSMCINSTISHPDSVTDILDLSSMCACDRESLYIISLYIVSVLCMSPVLTHSRPHNVLLLPAWETTHQQHHMEATQ